MEDIEDASEWVVVDEDGPMMFPADHADEGPAVLVQTFGCTHNAGDSERMSSLLARAGAFFIELVLDDLPRRSLTGYRLVRDLGEADCVVINSCTVKGPSEAHAMTLLRRAKERGKGVVVAGCVPQADPRNVAWDGVCLVGVRQIGRVCEAVEAALRGDSIRFLSRTRGDMVSLRGVTLRRNPLIGIVPVCTGCLGRCTFCKTKHARGELASWPVTEVVDCVRACIADGVVEVQLTGEDLGAYGMDLGTDIVTLLKAVLCSIPLVGVKVRLGMTNPPHILRHLAGLIPLLNDPRVYRFLHCCVQSGSDQVLTAMKREHSAEEFGRLCEALISGVPGITIATDVICGFPGETEDDFECTLSLVRQFRFPVLNISQFYPRPGTPAARMKRVNSALVKERTRTLAALFESFRPWDDLGGRITDVLVTERGKVAGEHVGRTPEYVQVAMSAYSAPLGSVVRATLEPEGRWHVRGQVVSVVHAPGNEGVKAADTKQTVPWRVLGVALCILPAVLGVITAACGAPVSAAWLGALTAWGGGLCIRRGETSTSGACWLIVGLCLTLRAAA